ncbi:hypothetical protein NDK43_26490 [Neobacillus pocheonensis]|uniref:Uncharacterized protein n=1 Tax=Neobacillus pocheonensis TaxID=363869 RepID=A0ABT0WG13_9BACI|nr:hypothetical protein [Neobacillus pocheonensis]
MVSTFIKRSVLLLFTFGFFVCSYTAIQRYLHNNKPTVYPAVLNVQLQKQNAAANGEVQKLQSSVSEAKKVKTATDKQYSNLMAEKNSLTKKE